MDQVLTAILLMTGLALASGAVLALGYRYFRVEEDRRLRALEDLLGGSNCGACGEPGCRPFAEALLEGRSRPSQCTVAAPEAIAEIAALLGVEPGTSARRVARLHCAGGRSAVPMLARYTGVPTCVAAYQAQRGGRACAYGCLGFGDCQVACGFDAIEMNSERLPVVLASACTACGDCVDACPAGLFGLQRVDQPITIQCRSPLEGERARASCAVACDACGRCALDAPPGVIEMRGGLPHVVQPERATEQCTYRCPTGAIAWVHESQFAYDVPLSALRRHYG
ncbi:MAG: 4Fe-4S binding protein [Myxococcales bacterium]|nr:4Fe-4S binding protein [Myxococcales bacterium]MDD9969048.1 4Fe-4S binding protein [Myxococcales bacterium]